MGGTIVWDSYFSGGKLHAFFKDQAPAYARCGRVTIYHPKFKDRTGASEDHKCKSCIEAIRRHEEYLKKLDIK